MELTSEVVNFPHLGVCTALNSELEKLKWSSPTEIQKQVIPSVLEGRDIIGLAETGSGKTGAFAIPILNKLLECGSRLYALVLSPTRELSFQINDVFEALGSGMGLLTTCIVGGIEMVEQAIILAKRPHVIIATPGTIFCLFFCFVLFSEIFFRKVARSFAQHKRFQSAQFEDACD